MLTVSMTYQTVNITPEKRLLRFMPVATGEHSGHLHPKFLCPPKFVMPRKVCFKPTLKTKILLT